MKTKEEVEERLEEFIHVHDLWQMKRSIVLDFIWGLLCDGRETRVCEYCGGTYAATRKDQRFCLGTCKKAFFNAQRQKGGGGKNP